VLGPGNQVVVTKVVRQVVDRRQATHFAELLLQNALNVPAPQRANALITLGQRSAVQTLFEPLSLEFIERRLAALPTFVAKFFDAAVVVPLDPRLNPATAISSRPQLCNCRSFNCRVVMEITP